MADRPSSKHSIGRKQLYSLLSLPATSVVHLMRAFAR
jgi:hypothetical protein